MKEAEGIIFFSYCGVSPDIEDVKEKYKTIRAIYPSANIVNPDRGILKADYKKVIRGSDVLIASENNGLVSQEVRMEVLSAIDSHIPVFVIRQDADGWVFYEVEGIKAVDEVTDIQFMNEIMLKHPDKKGISAIDSGLLSKPSDLFSDAQQEIIF